MDLMEDLKINPEELDLEWLRQPQLYAKWANVVARLRAEADRAKEQVQVIEADVDAEIRATYEKKPAEDAIKKIIAGDPRIRKARQNNLDAWAEYNQAQNAVSALDHKKAAMENLVRLFLAKWFSGPSSPRELKELAQDWQEKVENRRQDAVREVMKERKGGHRRGGGQKEE